MKHFVCLLIAFSTSICLFAQTETIRKYAAQIQSAELKKHLSIIASDSLQGRETGTIGQRMAADYLENQFRAIGLNPPQTLGGYQQVFPLQKDSFVSARLKIGFEELEVMQDFLIPLRSNNLFDISATELVFMGYGIDDAMYNDYLDRDVMGKIAVMITGEPKRNGKYFIAGSDRASDWSLEKKMMRAADAGAVAALVIDRTEKTFSERQIRRNRKTNVYPILAVPQGLPYALITWQTAIKFLHADFEAIEPFAREQLFVNEIRPEMLKSVSFGFFKGNETIETSNVLGVIEGDEKKDEYVFVTAHYDHLGIQDGVIYNGADDDGSGTVSLIEMARVFMKAKKEGMKLKRSLVFMAVSGEEKGLLGSEFYAEHPVFPLEKTSVDLNIDMIGRVDTERKKADTLNYIYVVGHDKISTDLQKINEAANKASSNLTLDYKFDDPKDPNRIYYRSDHYNFAKNGVPVLFFYDGMLKSDYHQPTDDIQYIKWNLFVKRARMIFHTAWDMAQLPTMLKRDLPMPTGDR